jgi:hypothetical protein
MMPTMPVASLWNTQGHVPFWNDTLAELLSNYPLSKEKLIPNQNLWLSSEVEWQMTFHHISYFCCHAVCLFAFSFSTRDWTHGLTLTGKRFTPWAMSPAHFACSFLSDEIRHVQGGMAVDFSFLSKEDLVLLPSWPWIMILQPPLPE